ncbi:MAG: hypothetical protein AB7K71_37560 [Polyangiaceae bacterium]
MLGASVSEERVETALSTHDCRSLTLIEKAGLWPFKARFAAEVVESKFPEAEVTRELWLGALETVERECRKRLTRRERAGVGAQIARLKAIIGLDDPVLVDLRSRLLHAMAQGDVDIITTLSSAISDREAAIDKRSARDFETKLKLAEARRRVAEKRRAEAEARSRAAEKSPAPSGTKQTEGGAAAVEKGISTAKSAKDAYDVARMILPF